MISQLKPLLSSRALTMTLASVGDDRIRVNVFPMKLNKEENSALSQPLSVEGTAEELDSELPAALVDYVATHLTVKQSLERTKAEMEAAEKAAKDEANTKKAKLTSKKPDKPETKPQEKTAERPRVEEPRPPSLFDDAPSEQAPSAYTGTTHAVEMSQKDVEDEILAEARSADDESDDEDEAA